MKNEFYQLGMRRGQRTPHPGPLPIDAADSADAEREKRSRLLGAATAVNGSTAYGLYQMFQRRFLLPWGAGQDEGKSGINLKPVHSNKTNWS